MTTYVYYTQFFIHLKYKLPMASSGFMFHCSEVAACIGDNKYKKRWEAFEAIFKRVHGGKYYTQAVSRLAVLGFEIVTTDQKIEQVASGAQSVDTRTIIDDFLKTPASTSLDLQRAVETFESGMVTEETRFKNQKSSLKETLIIQQTKEKHLIAKPSDEIDEELVKVQSILKRTADDLLAHEKEWADFKVAKSELIRQKQTAFGRQNEDVLIQSGSIGIITNNNSKLYTAVLGSEPMPWGICGRIDGFRDGELVEIKNRKSHLYNPLPLYDIIQVQCYMQILGVGQATLIQSLALGDGTFQTDETIIIRDDEYWMSHILSGLKTVIASLDEFCRDTLLQDQYFQTPDSKKTFFMNKLLKKHDNTSQNTAAKRSKPTEPSKPTKPTAKSGLPIDKSKITSFFQA